MNYEDPNLEKLKHLICLQTTSLFEKYSEIFDNV